MKTDLFENQLTGSVRDLRQIWLAGLGAFARVQEEGGKFFETLVQDGQGVDARMRKAAERESERVKGGIEAIKDKAEEIRDEATAAWNAEQIESGIEAVKGRAEEIRSKATGAWNKLEEVFQTRVARALHRLGVPGRDDIQQLFEQIDLLERNIRELTQAVEAEGKPGKARAIKAPRPAAINKIAAPVA